MIIDPHCTRLIGRSLILPNYRPGRLFTRQAQWWTPQGDIMHHGCKVVSRHTGELLWINVLDDPADAIRFKQAFDNGQRPYGCPGFDTGVVCLVFTSTSFTSGTGSWTVPSGVSSTELLVVGGGGGGASGGTGSGGGAGGVARSASYGVTPADSLGYTVGGGGATQTTAGKIGRAHV